MPAVGVYDCFFAQTVHHPCAATVQSMVLQVDGASNCTQFSQRCSLFGVS